MPHEYALDRGGTPITPGARVQLMADWKDGPRPELEGVVLWIEDAPTRVHWRAHDGFHHASPPCSLRVVASVTSPLPKSITAAATAAISDFFNRAKDSQ